MVESGTDSARNGGRIQDKGRPSQSSKPFGHRAGAVARIPSGEPNSASYQKSGWAFDNSHCALYYEIGQRIGSIDSRPQYGELRLLGKIGKIAETIAGFSAIVSPPTVPPTTVGGRSPLPDLGFSPHPT